MAVMDSEMTAAWIMPCQNALTGRSCYLWLEKNNIMPPFPCFYVDSDEEVSGCHYCCSYKYVLNHPRPRLCLHRTPTCLLRCQSKYCQIYQWIFNLFNCSSSHRIVITRNSIRPSYSDLILQRWAIVLL